TVSQRSPCDSCGAELSSGIRSYLPASRGLPERQERSADRRLVDESDAAFSFASGFRCPEGTFGSSARETRELEVDEGSRRDSLVATLADRRDHHGGDRGPARTQPPVALSQAQGRRCHFRGSSGRLASRARASLLEW